MMERNQRSEHASRFHLAPPWPRGLIPVEAREAGLIVDMQRLMGAHWTAAERREEGARYASTRRMARNGVTLPLLTDDDVARVRAARADVFARWVAIASGDTLELLLVRWSEANCAPVANGLCVAVPAEICVRPTSSHSSLS